MAFNVSFEHRQAQVAKQVADDLVTLFLDENLKQRTERANETTEFLTQEANKLGPNWPAWRTSWQTSSRPMPTPCPSTRPCA